MNRYIRILICPKCEKQLDDTNIIHNYIENGIYVECNVCNDETVLVPGLIVIGHEATDECEQFINKMNRPI